MAEALIALCITLVLLPPRWDPAILIKEYQMGHIPPNKFFRGLRNAILPTLLLWAALGFVVWLILN